jgi:hypothetical protein
MLTDANLFLNQIKLFFKRKCCIYAALIGGDGPRVCVSEVLGNHNMLSCGFCYQRANWIVAVVNNVRFMVRMIVEC